MPSPRIIFFVGVDQWKVEKGADTKAPEQPNSTPLPQFGAAHIMASIGPHSYAYGKRMHGETSFSTNVKALVLTKLVARISKWLFSAPGNANRELMRAQSNGTGYG